MNPIIRMMKRYIKTPLKYALPLLFIGALILVSTSGCLSSLVHSSTSGGSPTAAPTATIGTASNSRISITAVNQGTYTSSNQFEQPAAGNKYVQIYVTFTNINDPGASIGNQLFFTLFDSNNVGHQPTLASFGEGGLQSLSNSNPGQKTAGTMIFEISQSANPATLVYNDLTNDLRITLGAATPTATPASSVTPTITPAVISPTPTPTPTATPSPSPGPTLATIAGPTTLRTGQGGTWTATVLVNGVAIPQSQLSNQIDWFIDGQAAGGTWSAGTLTTSISGVGVHTLNAEYLGDPSLPNASITVTVVAS